MKGASGGGETKDHVPCDIKAVYSSVMACLHSGKAMASLNDKGSVTGGVWTKSEKGTLGIVIPLFDLVVMGWCGTKELVEIDVAGTLRNGKVWTTGERGTIEEEDTSCWVEVDKEEEEEEREEKEIGGEMEVGREIEGRVKEGGRGILWNRSSCSK